MTPLLSLQLDYQYRDFAGEYLARVAEQLKEIEAAGCYVPRYYHAPANSQQSLTVGSPYLRYTLEIPPGSFILAIKHNRSAGFVCNVTDIGLNHSIFSDPVPDSYLLAGATPGANPGQMAYYFAKPYPVVTPGRFVVEFWNTTVETVNADLVLQVAEVVTHVQQEETSYERRG